jgi:dTDP-4-amino-4,6-dideoxygalactose transaminase
VETRRWYEAGQHVQPHFSTAPADPLAVTESLGERLLGLPMAHDLSAGDVGHIVDCLAEAAKADHRAPALQK